MTKIEELMEALKAAENARNNAFEELQAAMIAESPYQVGSLVDAEQYGKMMRCRVTNLHIEKGWRDGYMVCGSAYPLTKSGSVAKIGEIRLKYSDKVVAVSEAAPVAESVLA